MVSTRTRRSSGFVVVVEASFKAFFAIALHGIGCQCDDGPGESALAQSARGRVAIHDRHGDIHHDKIDRCTCFTAQQLERFGPF